MTPIPFADLRTNPFMAETSPTYFWSQGYFVDPPPSLFPGPQNLFPKSVSQRGNLETSTREQLVLIVFCEKALKIESTNAKVVSATLQQLLTGSVESLVHQLKLSSKRDCSRLRGVNALILELVL